MRPEIVGAGLSNIPGLAAPGVPRFLGTLRCIVPPKERSQVCTFKVGFPEIQRASKVNFRLLLSWMLVTSISQRFAFTSPWPLEIRWNSPLVILLAWWVP